MNTTSEYCSAFNKDSSETVAYNNPRFPAYVRQGILSRYPDYSGISHWHEDLEFILVKKGRMTYNVNGELIELCENSGIMVNSRQLHFGFSASCEECEFICILLSTELLCANKWFLENYVEHITENPYLPYLYLEDSGWKKDILRKLDQIYGFNKDPIEALAYFEVIESFVCIMKLLYQNLNIEEHSPKTETSELSSLRDMITFIEKNFTHKLRLSDIALAGACCNSRCCMLFKKYLRDTPIRYVTKLRLRKSLADLLDSDACITDIAYEYGFCGASYYCESFQKYYGMSPLQYKKRTI